MGSKGPLFFGKINMNSETVKKIESKITPILENIGYDLIDVELKPEGGGRVLRIFIDKENGVNIDDCEKVSRSIEDIIEVEGYISQNYRLEVSSPGWDRPLKKKDDFVKYTGKQIRLESNLPINQRRRWKGELLGLENDNIKMKVDGNVYFIPWDNLGSARIVPDESEWR